MCLEVMSLKELMAWEPRGTVTTTYRLPADRQADAEKVLRKAGFRVTPDPGFPAAEGEATLSVIRHYGTKNPPGDVQQRHMAEAEAALRKILVNPAHVAHGITVDGGTPGHRWLTVAVHGIPSELKVVASTEHEAEQKLDQVAESLQGRVARDALSVIRPDGWPVTSIFGV
ncbi:MAG: hypothetical protein ACR2MP_01365 [Streptosporangiaceae bacterium]